MHLGTRVLYRIGQPLQHPVENILILTANVEQVGENQIALRVRIGVGMPTGETVYAAIRNISAGTEYKLILTNPFQVSK